MAGAPVKAPAQKAKSPAFCYNCSKRGHYGHECTAKRMFNGTYPTLPFVSGYNSSWELKSLEYRAQKYLHELQNAGLVQQDQAPAGTPQPPRKKQRPNPKNSPFPFTPSGRTPKKRTAHTPKHHPERTPREHTHTPGQKATPLHQLEGKKKKKKKKKNGNKGGLMIDVDQDFPRGFPKSPHGRGSCTPAWAGRARPTALFGSGQNSEMSNKKKYKLKKRERKAAKDQNQPSDENLFLIKQRKR